jgi:hypothetical protein
MSGRRAKGYMEWKPSLEVAHVVSLAREVLAEYASYGPMTVRQIFYRLVGQHDYEKTERAYKRLAEYLVKARRSQMIDFSRIRDDGTVSHGARGHFNREEFWQDLRREIESGVGWYRLDRQMGQPHHIELWCEAGGMAPMLAGMVRHLNIPVYSTGGFSSVTVTHEVAQRVLGRDRPTVFLHIGDYDPSGESIFESMSQDIGAFVVGAKGGSWNARTGEVLELRDGSACLFRPRRVALTEAQVEQYDLPTAPPKMSDSRSANWIGETTQAEAMPPDLLEEVVTGYIGENLTDPDALALIEWREERDKRRLQESMDEAGLLGLVEEMARKDAEA